MLQVLAAGSTTSNLFLMIEIKNENLIITLENIDVNDYYELMQILIFCTRQLLDDSTYYPNAYLLSELIEQMLPMPSQMNLCKNS